MSTTHQKILKAKIEGASLSADEMEEVVGTWLDGDADPIAMAAFLTALRCHGETSAEIVGTARAMRSRMTPIHVPCTPLMDTCGTGGAKSPFNVSTAVAFVVAGAGVAVAKHGNRAASSQSGSADVLECLGISLALSPQETAKAIEEIGIGFIFARKHHPHMAQAAPIRKALGIRTIFNLVGPLCNPAGAKHQLLGVFDRRFVPPMAKVLAELGSEKAWVVHGAGGFDELSLAGSNDVAIWDGVSIRHTQIAPEDYGFETTPAHAIQGGSPQQNAEILKHILQGEDRSANRDLVIFNAAAALEIAGVAQTPKQAVEAAYESITTGAAFNKLTALSALRGSL